VARRRAIGKTGIVPLAARWSFFQTCMSGDDVPAPARCLGAGLTADDTGTFALHGRPVDVLPDGKILIPVRARTDDPQHARWLQRDPKPDQHDPRSASSAGGRDGGSAIDPGGQAA
jgi:hypothetical protein